MVAPILGVRGAKTPTPPAKRRPNPRPTTKNAVDEKIFRAASGNKRQSKNITGADQPCAYFPDGDGPLGLLGFISYTIGLRYGKHL